MITKFKLKIRRVNLVLLHEKTLSERDPHYQEMLNFYHPTKPYIGIATLKDGDWKFDEAFYEKYNSWWGRYEHREFPNVLFNAQMENKTFAEGEWLVFEKKPLCVCGHSEEIHTVKRAWCGGICDIDSCYCDCYTPKQESQPVPETI